MLRTQISSFRRFCFALVLFLPFSLVAQTSPNSSRPVVNILKDLEEQFNIKFSYINQDIEDFNTTIPSNLVALEDVISYLEAEFQIKLEKLSDRYYSIVKESLVDVCGRVLDNFAENTVMGATVEVLDSEIALTTDMEGNFQLRDVPRKASLKIRFLGYITQYVSVEKLISGKDCPKTLMAQNYQQLKEVTVYKFLTTGIIKEEDASITLNTADFGILPGLIEPDVLQTVQALPGIKSIDETVSDINVRGGTNDQNLILWNGIKMYQSGHFFGLISAFNPYLTDKVTIIKNGTPANYGDGVSSVIQMETNNEISDTFFGGAGFNFISGDLYGQIPLKQNLAFQFSARRSTTDFLNTPTYDRFFDRAFQDSEVIDENNMRRAQAFSREENFFFYDFTAKLLYDINESHKLRLNFININNDLNFEETNLDNDETTNSLLDQTNFSAGAQLASQWTDKFSSNLNFYYTNYNLDAQNLFANQIQLLFQNNQVEETALKLGSSYTIAERLSWNNGYQFIETGIRNRTIINQPQFSSNVKGVIRIHAPHTDLFYSTENKHFIGRIGARVNYIENLGTFNRFLIEPRLNINFRVANYLRAQVLGEFKSQTTNQVVDLEQNFLGIEKRRWVLSDDNALPVTQSKQASVGLNYEKNDLYVGIEGFYKRVDGISTSTQGFQNQNQFNGEIGLYDVQGVELLINKRGGNYSTWFSYTFNKNDYTFTTIDPNSFPNNLDIRHTLTFASTYTYEKLKLGLGINYRTGRPFTEPQEGDEALNTSVFPAQINFQEPNSSRLPEYLRVDASAIYKFDISRRVKANAGISVLNLTDRKNILNTYYRVADDNQIETVENISLGITPNLSFRVSF
ncbi:TonB-dependent receptor [Flagellimonas meridianipacifica]|uniref:Outer membrane receptor protein involved in Fe transport n=1 Tax=Flagellimonas meridianipacifica TaxID=1080225 RepID=A0A2T0M8E6_9FLAO|nr:carboxypeptidase-like regulatory domain-containing protein [Allomuricauda pacifica]PRX53743.1 outer membrane receptor protein involved in Fe transport [Allomuricauda pacifica]